MYFELQLSAGIFTRIVRNRFKAVPLCVDRQFPDPDHGLLVVDRIDVGDATLIQREQTIELVDGVAKPRAAATQSVWIFSPTSLFAATVPFLQVKQEILIHLVPSSGLDANGPAATAPVKTFTIHPVFNVSLSSANQTQGGGPVTLSYGLSHVDFGALFNELSQPQRDGIQQLIAGVKLAPSTVDMGPLAALLKRPVSAINAGIACDPAGSFVALRVDFDVYASPVAVTSAFFEAGPTNLLAGKDWAMIIDANLLVADARGKAHKALANAPKVRLNSGPDVSWDPAGPAIDISAEVELVDACPFFVEDIDMDADVDIRVSFAVPADRPNTLRTHFHIEPDPSNVAEEIACALTSALLWPFLGPVLLKDEELGIGIGAYFGGLAVGPAGVFIGIVAAIESKGLTKDIAEDLGSTCAKIDNENYECNDVMNIVMSLSPPLNSRLMLERVSGITEGLVVSGTIANLGNALQDSVQTVGVKPFAWQVVGRCTGNRQSNFRIANQAKISVFGAAVCNAYVISDREGEFALTVGDNEIVVVPAFKAAYAANPYPCRVRVVTRRGVRTITLDPPAAVSAGQTQELESERLRRFASCFFLERSFTAVEKIKWLIDPPRGERDFLQFWQVVVRGLQPGNTIVVKNPSGGTLMSAAPSEAGVAHFTLTLPGDEAVPELSLEMLGEQTEGGDTRQMSVQQVRFERQATLPASGSLRALRFEGNSGGMRLIESDARGETTWDMANPAAPSVLRSISRSGEDEARDLVVHAARRVGAPPTANLRSALKQIGDCSDCEDCIGVVGAPRVGGIPETLYVRGDQRGTLFDIGCSGEPRAMHVYEQPAWFEGVAMGGRLLARHDPLRDVIEVYHAAVVQNL